LSSGVIDLQTTTGGTSPWSSLGRRTATTHLGALVGVDRRADAPRIVIADEVEHSELAGAPVERSPREPEGSRRRRGRAVRWPDYSSEYRLRVLAPPLPVPEQ
jgi:hypothetical protein